MLLINLVKFNIPALFIRSKAFMLKPVRRGITQNRKSFTSITSLVLVLLGFGNLILFLQHLPYSGWKYQLAQAR